MSQCARCGAQLRVNSMWCLACGERVEGYVPPAELEQADETIAEWGAQRVPVTDEAFRPPAAIPSTIVEAEPRLGLTPVVETAPEEPPASEPELGTETIAVTVPSTVRVPVDRTVMMDFFPRDPAAPPTLEQSRPAPAAKGRSVPVALILLPLLFFGALAAAAAYYVLTREPVPVPVRETSTQPPIKRTPDPAPDPVPAQLASTATVTQSLETQGPPAPQPELEIPSPVPPKEENRTRSSKPRGSKKPIPSPEPEPEPELQPAPEPPKPVDPMAVVEPGPGVTRAEVVYKAPLRLPLRARMRRVRGRATVEVIVRTDGSPESPTVIESSGNQVFDTAARTAAMQSRFAPGIRDGERVRMRTRISYSNVSSQQETEPPPPEE